jgi:hypothetical protein
MSTGLAFFPALPVGCNLRRTSDTAYSVENRLRDSQVATLAMQILLFTVQEKFRGHFSDRGNKR